MIAHHVYVTALTGVSYATLRQWAHRLPDKVTAHPGGRFDLVEVRKRLLERDTRRDRYHHAA